MFIVSLFACNSNKKQNPYLQFPKPIELEAIEYPNDLIVKSPKNMKQIGNKLMLFYVGNDDHIIRILDANKGTLLQEWGVFGNGPEELNNAFYWGSNDNNHLFWLYDTNHKTLHEYHWNEKKDSIEIISQRTISSPKNLTLSVGSFLTNENFISNVILGTNKPIILLNNQLDSLQVIGEIPDDEHEPFLLKTYTTNFAAVNNSFVGAMSYFGYIAFYELNSKGKVIKKWDHYIEKPEYTEDQLKIESLKVGYKSIAMNDKYIFTSYCGKIDNKMKRQQDPTYKAYPETILMFDHKGNLLYNFHTKGKKIGTITISEDGKTIYAVTYEPEIAIVRYDISPYI